MEPFKNIFNLSAVDHISRHIQRAAPKAFDKKAFQKHASAGLESLELKDRVRHIADALHVSIKGSYQARVKGFIKALAKLEEVEGKSTHSQSASSGLHGFMVWPLLQYIETHGLDDFETSFAGMHAMTQRFTAEFAIRPFLMRDDVWVFKQLNQWKGDPSDHVRRLCSEGIRLNLPWGLKVPVLERKLNRNVKMLNTLKFDPSKYVQTSVANHLKDISSVDPDLMVTICQSWIKAKKQRKTIQWIIAKASQNLLKKGHPDVFRLNGFDPELSCALEYCRLSQSRIAIGDSVRLQARIILEGRDQSAAVMLHYGVDYPRPSGKSTKKRFVLKRGIIKPSTTFDIDKAIPFKSISTRRLYPGAHGVDLWLNGQCIATMKVSVYTK